MELLYEGRPTTGDQYEIAMNPDPEREHEAVVLFTDGHGFSFFSTTTVLLLNVETMCITARYTDRRSVNDNIVCYLDTGDRILVVGDVRNPQFRICAFASHRLECLQTVQVTSDMYTNGRPSLHSSWKVMPFVTPCEKQVNVVLRPPSSCNSRFKAEIVSFRLTASDGVMALKKLCRATILRHCRHTNIKRLTLPQRLLDFLKGY